MRTAVEPLEGNKVKVSVEVDEEEFERAIDAAFRKISREVRIPGFRPGKAPRRILEARLGKQTGRSEALRDALPEYYSEALREHEVDAIAAPHIDITAGEEAGAVSFDAVVEVRPQLQLSGYRDLTVTIPGPEVTDADIDAQVDRLRGNFGHLGVVDRPARTGDTLTIDLHGTRDGQAVAGMTSDDFAYELGSGSVLPELDEQLQGAKPGDILAFDAELPDGSVSLRVLVKEVKETVLPELTDAWAEEASEFATVEELRANLARQIGVMKRVQAVMALRNGALQALVDLVDDEPPAALVDAEVESQAHQLGHRLEAQGATIDQYLRATGQTADQVVSELRGQAVPAVKADLALRAVAEAEGIEVTEEDLAAHLIETAPRYGMSPDELRQNLERASQVPAVRSDLRKSKALEWLVEHVDLVDTDGRPVDRALLEPAADGADEPRQADPSDPAPTEPVESEPS